MSDRGFQEAAKRYQEVRGTAPRDKQLTLPFDDFMSDYDEPLACGVEDPESCESCQ